MKVLLDTCAILYSELQPRRFSGKARQILLDPATEISVSVISVAELACGWGRRFVLKKHWKPWFREAVEANGWQVVPLNLEIVEEAYSLPEPFHRDPVDRLMVATARLQGMALMTNDQLITRYPYVEVCW